MSTLMNRPYRDVAPLSEVDRLFRQMLGGGPDLAATAGAFAPALDVEDRKRDPTTGVPLWEREWNGGMDLDISADLLTGAGADADADGVGVGVGGNGGKEGEDGGCCEGLCGDDSIDGGGGGAESEEGRRREASG